MQRIFIYLLIFSTIALIFPIPFCQAQDNRRYRALSLVNVNNGDYQLEQIQKASDIGMNSVIITVRWDVILYPWQVKTPATGMNTVRPYVK